MSHSTSLDIINTPLTDIHFASEILMSYRRKITVCTKCNFTLPLSLFLALPLHLSLSLSLTYFLSLCMFLSLCLPLSLSLSLSLYASVSAYLRSEITSVLDKSDYEITSVLDKSDYEITSVLAINKLSYLFVLNIIVVFLSHDKFTQILHTHAQKLAKCPWLLQMRSMELEAMIEYSRTDFKFYIFVIPSFSFAHEENCDSSS